jgi:hypothetical protein
MNKPFHIFFTSFSVIRFLCILAFFVVDEIRYSDNPDIGFLDGFTIELEFEWWEYLFMYTFLIVYPLNTIISLLLCFKPKWIFNGFLRRKIILLVPYIGELLIVPLFTYFAIERINDTFFPPESTSYLSDIISAILPPAEVSVYEKWDAINMAVLAFCSLLFVLFFWNYYSARKKALTTSI